MQQRKVLFLDPQSIVLLIVFLFLSLLSFAQTVCIPVSLRCEYLQNPIGIDAAHPRFTWWVEDKRKGARQTTFQIIVGTDSLSVNKGTGNRLRQQLVDSVTGEVVESANKAHGYEVGQNQFLVVDDAELDKASAPVRFRSRDARTAVGYDHGGNPTGTLREPQNAKDRCRRTDLRGGHERRDKQAAGERETLEIDYFDLVLRRSRWRSHERDRCHANDAQDRRAGYLVKDLQIGQPTNSEASRMVSVRFSLRVASDWWRIFQPPPIFMMFDVVRQGCQECI